MTLPVMTLLLTTALPSTNTPPPAILWSAVRTSPMPPLMVQPSMEKSVRGRPLERAAKMTAARPLPVVQVLLSSTYRVTVPAATTSRATNPRAHAATAHAKNLPALVRMSARTGGALSPAGHGHQKEG